MGSKCLGFQVLSSSVMSFQHYVSCLAVLQGSMSIESSHTLRPGNSHTILCVLIMDGKTWIQQIPYLLLYWRPYNEMATLNERQKTRIRAKLHHVNECSNQPDYANETRKRVSLTTLTSLVNECQISHGKSKSTLIQAIHYPPHLVASKKGLEDSWYTSLLIAWKYFDSQLPPCL